jgi:hypothetical protein
MSSDGDSEKQQLESSSQKIVVVDSEPNLDEIEDDDVDFDIKSLEGTTHSTVPEKRIFGGSKYDDDGASVMRDIPDPPKIKQSSFLELGGTSSEFGVSVKLDLVRKYSHVGDKIMNMINNLAVHRENYLGMVIALMEIVEEHEELNGDDKSNLVTYYTGLAGKKCKMFDSDEDMMLFLHTLPNMYQVITKMTKGEITLIPTKDEKIQVRKEVNVITYSVFEHAQKFVSDHSLEPSIIVITAPQIIFEIAKETERFTFLRAFEKDLLVNKVIEMFIENFNKIFPSTSKRTYERLMFTFQQMHTFPSCMRSVQRKEFYINTKAKTVNLNRAPVQVHRSGCFPLLCR